jgi:hypothetical protein
MPSNLPAANPDFDLGESLRGNGRRWLTRRQLLLYLQDEDQFFSELTIITPSLLSWLMRRTDMVFPYSRRFAQNFWE